ncbi:hypothetical protein L228DRAFT_285255 [Xylona heveae TC161]|uniref:Geranylgeranyl pyrophosphate synthetase n=1 Tax=Xylona heveae (strain CBS 132557 / TC161) TaxID=1328760 RepID=A0A165A260_XYLHT|nr:hypothetical protein L228DRAFT_285255 [Xylona heveae TC161]KZF19848.1 hypothetical protein L228DRAFT_285255 [Xylona heveae TC161]
MYVNRQSNRGSSSTPGRGAGRGYFARGRSNFRGRPVEVPRAASPPLGEILERVQTHETDLIEFSDSEDENDNKEQEHSASLKIVNCKDVATFNWMNKATPTILVPGKPPAWTPLHSPRRLPEDGGAYFRDKNAAQYPSRPIEPAVQALLTLNPNFPTSSIDIFACNSTLGNLLRHVFNRVERPFRFLVEAVGNTVFFVRRENSPTQLIDAVRGFGHTFPEAYTTWESDVRGSDTHQRIVQYEFGGLNFLVRFAADGYYKDLVPNDTTPGSKLSDSPKPTDESSIDDTLALALGESTIASRLSTSITLSSSSSSPSLSLSSSSSPSSTSSPQVQKEQKLTILQDGSQLIPRAAVFDIKTRSVRKKDTGILAGELPRLWAAQNPNFVLAYHQSGLFEDIEETDIRDDIQRWERRNEDALRTYADLLKKIITFARARKDGKFEVVCSAVDGLVFREQGGDDVSSTLSSAVQDRWLGKKHPVKE